ncbi:MAG: hypothetical protein ACRDRJ_22915 [Streptosporangiaceae bacterium]
MRRARNVRPAPRRDNSLSAVVGIVLGVALAYQVFAGGHHGVSRGSGAVTDAAAGITGQAPDGSSYTAASWAAALLRYGGWPQTSCDIGAMEAWEGAEGGQWGPNPNDDGTLNPLNTTHPEPGSTGRIYTGTPGVWVQAYATWQSGFQATVATLDNGRYGPILAALQAGNDAQAVADAVTASPWGTGSFTARCAS